MLKNSSHFFEYESSNCEEYEGFKVGIMSDGKLSVSDCRNISQILVLCTKN